MRVQYTRVFLLVITLFINSNVDEIIIRRVASSFAGAELIKRQNLQRAQKGLVTKSNKEISKYKAQIEIIKKQVKEPDIVPSTDLSKQIKELTDKNTNLIKDNALLSKKNRELTNKNNELIKSNNYLKKDNKDLKNIVDAIKLKLAIEIKYVLKLKDINEIKKRLFKLLKSTLG